MKEGDDAFGQQVTVREYFHKERSTTYPPFEMHDYGTGKEQGRYGSNSDQTGTKEFYYKSFCRFPRTPSEGDEICLVGEVSDGTGKGPGKRNVWKFVFRADLEDPAGVTEEAQEEETHSEDSPDWIRSEFPGHWDLTGISFIGGIRGLKELERRVDSGSMAAAFSMYPTSLDELFAVADAGELMPPKSTWFEPKLLSGLFIHRL